MYAKMCCVESFPRGAGSHFTRDWISCSASVIVGGTSSAPALLSAESDLPH
jgi:hypothetical protein